MPFLEENVDVVVVGGRTCRMRGSSGLRKTRIRDRYLYGQCGQYCTDAL